MKKTMKLSLIFVSLLALSGCSATPLESPKAPNQNSSYIKTFSQPVNPLALRPSIVEEIQKSGWKVLDNNSDANEVLLRVEKSYKYKPKYFNHSAYRGSRAIKEESIVINISLNSNELRLILQSVPNEKIKEVVHNDIEEIQKSTISRITTSQM